MGLLLCISATTAQRLFVVNNTPCDVFVESFEDNLMSCTGPPSNFSQAYVSGFQGLTLIHALSPLVPNNFYYVEVSQAAGGVPPVRGFSGCLNSVPVGFPGGPGSCPFFFPNLVTMPDACACGHPMGAFTIDISLAGADYLLTIN